MNPLRGLRPGLLACALASLGSPPSWAGPVAAKKASAPPPGRPSRQYTIEQFMATTAAYGASFSPDEKKLLFSSNKSGIFNVYTIPTGGGPVTEVTRSTTDSTWAISYFPRDERILYTRDQGGNEENHLYVLGTDGKERDLTPGKKIKAIFGKWTRDGSALYLTTNERDPRFFDVYRMDNATYKRTLVYKDEVGYDFVCVSDDGRYVALNKIVDTSDMDIYLWDVARQQLRHVTPHKGQAEYGAAGFDVTSRWLYYTTNDGTEFLRVRRYDLQTGKHEEVEKADWDIAETSFSLGGKYRVDTINEDGRTNIKVYETATGRSVPLPRLPDGEISSVRISPSEKRMAFYVNGDRSPNNLYVYTFGDKAPARLLETLSPQIDAEDLVASQVVRFPSFDGMSIPSIFYKPQRASPRAKAPALVFVHGGPGGQTRRTYMPLIQYLVNHGYVVLGINNRGSYGYGKTFFMADDRRHGREPLWDCVEGKKYLAGLPYVDGNRVGIIGSSYGGYMALAALAFQPEVFAAGVDIVGVANWLRTLESMPPWMEQERRWLYKEIGDPVKDREMLRQISPLFHADKIRRPLAVLQGANDPRVIKAESDDIVAAVRKNGVPVEYLVFPDEGHGFKKRKNQIEAYRAILNFLDLHLRGTGEAVAGTKQP